MGPGMIAVRRHRPLFQLAEFAVCVGCLAYGDCKASAARHLHVEFRALSDLPGADDICLRIGLVIGIGGIGVERRHVLLTGIEVVEREPPSRLPSLHHPP